MTHIYVSCDAARDAVAPVCGNVPVEVQGSLFFR
jgi:hypothetical protein